MSDSFRDKLGGYLNDELEELKFLRSVSPYAYSIGSRSPRRQSRSPRPNKSEHSPTAASSSATTEPKLCSAPAAYCPEIAAWPVPSVEKPLVNKPSASMKPPTIITSSLSPSSASIDESSKLLSMLKVVAASSHSSPGPGGHVRYDVMGTFRDYGERVAERERKLEAEYSNKIIALSEEVLGAKKDFETRMKSFQALQEQFEREKEQALEKLRQEHQKEIQVLEQRFRSLSYLTWNRSELQKKCSETTIYLFIFRYIIEIQRLEEERKSLRTEKERLGETFERKLRRAQSLYETELTAAKLLYTKELEALRDHEEALKDELAARQEEKLRKKELEVQNISREMSTAKNETNEALKKLTEAKTDLEGIRKDYHDQKAEFDKKLKLLNVAETARQKLESTIRELQIEVKALRNKVDFLEMERDNLQSQSESQTQLHNSQVQALEAVLELLEREREQAEEREYSIKKEFSTKLNELEDQYNALREHIEQSDSFGPENVKLWEEIECLRSEKSILEDEVTGLRTQLTQLPSQSPPSVNTEDMSLDYIIELLRAIDVVKKKVLQSGTSSRASENPEERPMSSLKEDYCSQMAGDSDAEELKEGFEGGYKIQKFLHLSSS
uniref:Protein FAM184A/B N-terminal domain-containing protein n=1 Tax=Ditylenchus dipsaci TaxID=166011 RepID=A0A915D4U9_9BILA